MPTSLKSWIYYQRLETYIMHRAKLSVIGTLELILRLEQGITPGLS